MSDFKAFTLKSKNGKFRDLKTPCGICRAFDPNCGAEHPEVLEFTGLWDTGASGTVISKKVVDALDLKPITKTKVFHAGGEGVANVYAINIFLPNSVAFPFVKVTEGCLNGMDVLIGMDIITLGDFSISNQNGSTTFSFRIPSIKEVDFVKEHNSGGTQSDSVPFPKVGRNDPCPCGSKKKFKYCHGK